ncbi:hypothetical protein BsWGS_07196 [Bradybaena similaris]
MAQASVRSPTCITDEVKGNIKVELLVDKLSGSKMIAKNGDVKVTISSFGFVMDAVVKSAGNLTKWHFKINKLPSEIIKEKSSWKIEPGRIVLQLHKKDNVSWAPFLGKRGLEQASDSSSGSDNEKSG